jgi:glycosyltransferase involved in cell wall biosynthesis
MKIGILYICTGNYTIFWDRFYQSSEKFLLKEHEKHYFVFTNGEINKHNNPLVKTIFQQKYGWPFDTLYRFKFFLEAEDDLKKMDYLFFFNANLVIMEPIGDEILPGEQDELVVTQHPGFFSKKRKEFTYETRKQSKAYIPPEKGSVYLAGGLNGGKTNQYLQMAHELSEDIDDDYRNNIVAIWHDESHVNRYIIDRQVKILSPAYLYPEGGDIPFEKKIIILDKTHFGGHEKLRNMSKLKAEYLEISNKMQQPLFSLLMANYNNAKYLPDAIGSVLSQHYLHWEIILIDDASTDDSLAVIESFASQDSRIKVFKNETNRGYAKTLVRCIQNAEGEILATLDSDDTLADPDALSIMANAHIRHPECSLIYSSMFVCDEFLNKQHIYEWSGIVGNDDFLITRDKSISHFATFKRSSYDQTEGINPEIKNAVDHENYFRLEEVGQQKFLDIPLYNYRVNTHSMSVGTHKKEIDAYDWHCRISVDAIRRRMKANATLYMKNRTVYHRDMLYYQLWVERKKSYRNMCCKLLSITMEYLRNEKIDRFLFREIRKFLCSFRQKNVLKIGFKTSIPALKILFIGHESSLTGAPVIGLSLLKWLRNQWNIRIDILLQDGGPLLYQYEQIGPTFVWKKRQKFLDRKISKLFHLKEINLRQRRFLKKCRRAGYDIIFANSVASSWHAYKVKNMIDAPLIMWVHELTQAINLHWKPDLKEKFMAVCDHYIVVSAFAGQNLTQNFGIHPDKILLTYGFLPDTLPKIRNEIFRKDLAIPDNAFLTGFSGTSYWWKSFELLPLLAKKVLNKNSQVEYYFLWVGGNKKDKEYIQMVSDAQKLGVADRIYFVETVPDPEQYFAMFDVFVMMSREDTFPLVCLENAYLGKPILCFEQSGGMPEFVEEDAGFIVPFLDLDKMAEKLIYLSENRDTVKLLGMNAQKKVKQQFNIEISAPKILDLIQYYSNKNR